MARKKKEEEHENHERWLVSYADFITLLFAFFVVMYAISSVNEGKYRVMSDSIVGAFRNTPGSDKLIVVSPSEQKSAGSSQIQLQTPSAKPELVEVEKEKLQRRENMKSVAGNLLNVMEPLVKGGQVKVTESNRGISIEINASLLFAPAHAELNQESIQVLTAVGKVLANDTHQVQIEGHTDNVQISGSLTRIFPTNWELSAARAINVTKYLQQQGIDPSALSAAAFAEHKPVADNSTREGKAKNRRIEITLVARD